MSVIKYAPGERLDAHTISFINRIKKRLLETDDDFRLGIFGDTGSGKSHLALHIYERVSGDSATVECIATNRKTYPGAMLHAHHMKEKGNKLVCCVNDEADIHSTETMTKYNKAVQRVMAQNRAAGIFHIWCMPNPARMQKDYFVDVFDAIMFVRDKSTKRPRTFAMFSGDKLYSLTHNKKDQFIGVTLRSLEKASKKRTMRTYLGCFKEYDGRLLSDYLKKKHEKIKATIKEFYEEFGEETYKKADLQRAWNVSEPTVYKYIDKALSDNVIQEGTHFIKTATGRTLINTLGKERIEEIYGFNK